MPTASRWPRFDLACAAVVDGDPEEAARLVHETAGVAERYRMAEAALVTDCALATLAVVAGRFDDAARRYDAVTAATARQGSLHAAGFAFLVRASLAVGKGSLAALLGAPDAGLDAPGAAERVFAEHGPILADVLAAVLAAGGHRDEARAMLACAVPPVPDYFFTLFTTFRALAAISLGDRDAAEQTYAALLPSEDGPPAGLESLSVALRPVQQTLGELALLLGRADDAARHFAAALETGERWGAPHWIAAARTARAAPQVTPAAPPGR